MQRTLLALALIVTAGASVGASYAQTDPYGHPFIGRNDWVAQPGDRTNAGAAPPVHYSRMNDEMAQAPAPEAMPMRNGPHQVAFKDEYGFRYDARGDRLDARGYVISPHTR
jgi:hypothetical protein